MASYFSEEELDETFNQIRSKCPREIKDRLLDWENWMLHYIHIMWKDALISNLELACLVDKVCTF